MHARSTAGDPLIERLVCAGCRGEIRHPRTAGTISPRIRVFVTFSRANRRLTQGIFCFASPQGCHNSRERDCPEDFSLLATLVLGRKETFSFPLPTYGSVVWSISRSTANCALLGTRRIRSSVSTIVSTPAGSRHATLRPEAQVQERRTADDSHREDGRGREDQAQAVAIVDRRGVVKQAEAKTAHAKWKWKWQ